MNKMFQYLAWALLGVAGTTPAFGGEKEEVAFRRIYGEQERIVNQSRDKKKHLTFGKKLVADSRKQGVSQAWEESLEDHAIEHLRKSGAKEAYQTILEIHQDDVTDFPKDKIKYLQLLVQDAGVLLKKISFRDKENRKGVQQFIAEANHNLADTLEQEGKYAEAAQGFTVAAAKYRALRQFDEGRESGVRASQNKKFQTAEGRRKDLETRAQRGDKKAHLAVGLEFFKKEDYDKAKQHFLHADGSQDYLTVIDLLTTNPSERVTSNGIREGQLKELKVRTEKKNAEGLVDLILQFTKESTLRRTAVVAAGKINYNEADRWDYLTGFSSTAENFMNREGKTPDFNLQRTLQAARLFEDVAKKEERRYVRAGLLGKAFGIYTVIKREAKGGSLESTEASTKVASLEKELERYGGVKVGGLELVAAGPKIPKGAVLYMTFDKGSIVQGDIKDGKIVKGDKWIVRDLSGKGNHGIIYGKFAAKGDKPIIFSDYASGVKAGYEIFLIDRSKETKTKGDVAVGFNTGHIEITDTGSLSNDYITISVWAKSNRNGSDYSDNAFIINKKNTNFATYSVGILSEFGKKMRFIIRLDGSESKFTDIYANNILDKNWHHYVSSYDGNKLRLNIDGRIQNDRKDIGGALDKNNPGILSIGSHPSKTAFWYGLCDNIIISNSILLK